LLLCALLLLLWLYCFVVECGGVYIICFWPLLTIYVESIWNLGLITNWDEAALVLSLLWRHSKVIYYLIVMRGRSRCGDSISSSSLLVDWHSSSSVMISKIGLGFFNDVEADGVVTVVVNTGLVYSSLIFFSSIND
jgi:hypothetical protein